MRKSCCLNLITVAGQLRTAQCSVHHSSPHSSATHASRSSRQHRHATFEVSCVLMFSARCCCCYKYEAWTSCGHSGRGESHNAKNVLVVRTVAGTVQNQCEGRRCFHCWCWSPTWSQPLSDLTIGAGSILLFTSRTWSWSGRGSGQQTRVLGVRMRHYLNILYNSCYALMPNTMFLFPYFLFPICCLLPCVKPAVSALCSRGRYNINKRGSEATKQWSVPAWYWTASCNINIINIGRTLAPSSFWSRHTGSTRGQGTL